MPLDAFRIFKTPGEKKKEDPIQRRRAQVRRAQRTYQERKNAYAKSLEEALSRSKVSEAELSLDNERLRNVLELVADKLPPALYASVRSPPAALHRQAITAAAASSVSPIASDGGSMAMSSTPSYASTSTSYRTSKPLPRPLETPVFTLQASMSSRLGAIHLGGFDETTIGMEFVLFLERPCLDHIHGDLETPHLANGHALTVTSQILIVSNNEGLEPAPDPLAISQTLSSGILSNLLDLAPHVNVYSPDEFAEEREITPIQAWDWIRRMQHFKQIQVHQLKDLLDDLGRVAKCYGFGATIPTREFERALYECVGSA